MTMAGARDPDRSVRPRLPRQAKLPKTPPRHPLRSSTHLTRSAGPALASVAAASYLTSPVSPDQLAQSDYDEDRDPLTRHVSPRKRKAVSNHAPASASKRPRRSTVTISYAESASDSDSDLDEIADTRYSGNPKGRNIDDDVFRSKASCTRRQSQTQKQVKADTTATAKEERIEKPSTTKDLSFAGNDLPYHVWRRICDDIASPLFDVHAHSGDVKNATVKLLELGFLGKLVYEPAMAALYKCPPIPTQAAFERLSETLQKSPSQTLIDYRPKVETLRIDAGDILYLKFGGSYLLLDDMIPHLPRLVDLELYHSFDQAPFRRLDETIRYKYPPNLLQILGSDLNQGKERLGNASPTELLSWRWNARLAGNDFLLRDLKTLHQAPSFASLRKIAFVNYQLPSTKRVSGSTQASYEKDACATADLAAAIKALPRLEHLIMESSTMADSNLLYLLPKTLKHIELINCWEVTADDLANFLLTHGSSLEQLTLNHCISLSMGFLHVLEQACPNLTHLYMNLRYYKAHEHYQDAQPLYSHLLKENEVPKWPASIQSIEFEYMRFGGVKTAEMLLRSLVTSAPKLPNLRRLVLGIKMDIGHHRRIKFRDFWQSRMSEIFERKSAPPVGFADEDSEMPVRSDPIERLQSRPTTKAPARRSTRPRKSPISPASEGSDRSTAAPSNLAKQLQWSMRDIPASKKYYAGDEESEDELAADLHGQLRLHDQNEDEHIEFIQGLCDVVEIKVDNQKPTEYTFRMDDFVDGESSGSGSDWDPNA